MSLPVPGKVIGFVPYHWAILAGILLQTAAQTAMHVLSKSLTDHYLIRANKTYFEPRGLKVRLMKTGALKRFTNQHGAQVETSKFSNFTKKTGRVIQNVALHIPLPIVGRAVEMFSDPVSLPFRDVTRDIGGLCS